MLAANNESQKVFIRVSKPISIKKIDINRVALIQLSQYYMFRLFNKKEETKGVKRDTKGADTQGGQVKEEKEWE